jgi:hypothetical protein
MAHDDFAGNIETMTACYGLRDDLWRAKEADTKTLISFNAPDRTGPSSILRVLVLDEVVHQYPRPTNNPHGFWAAEFFWNFFLKSTRGR